MKYYEITSINEFTYALKLNGDNIYPLYQVIKKIIKTMHYDTKTSSVYFSAEKVLSFKEYLLYQKRTHRKCIKIIDDLTKQILTLKEIGYGFYGFDLNDILTIDDHFIFCSSQHLLPIVDDKIGFYFPINKPYFCNPEILQLTILPSEISYNCVYYSLGVLVVLYLLNNYLLVGNEIKSVDEIEIILKPIYNTKIYWFIKRCLDENIDKRVLLLI